MVARTRLSNTLYVHCLSGLKQVRTHLELYEGKLNDQHCHQTGSDRKVWRRTDALVLISADVRFKFRTVNLHLQNTGQELRRCTKIFGLILL
jgi:hypothetical protein